MFDFLKSLISGRARPASIDGIVSSAEADVLSKWKIFVETVRVKKSTSLAQQIDGFAMLSKDYIHEKYPQLSTAPAEVLWLIIFNAVMHSGTHKIEEVNSAVATLKNRYTGTAIAVSLWVERQDGSGMELAAEDWLTPEDIARYSKEFQDQVEQRVTKELPVLLNSRAQSMSLVMLHNFTTPEGSYNAYTSKLCFSCLVQENAQSIKAGDKYRVELMRDGIVNFVSETSESSHALVVIGSVPMKGKPTLQ